MIIALALPEKYRRSLSLFRVIFVAASVIAPLRAAVVSRDWSDGRLAMKLDDGSAEMEWLSPVSFRFARSWMGAVPALLKLPHEKIEPTFEDAGPLLSMRTKFLTVE